MQKALTAALLSGILFTSAFAAQPGKDVTTNPELYYLKSAEVFDSFKLLPPPPDMDSIAFLNDQAQYQQGVLLRGTERGKLAASDADLAGDGVANAFSEAFGMEISRDNTPELHKLLTHFVEDAGDLATRDAKNTYQRIRPYVFYKTPPCNLKEMESLSTNGSYPSGHTSIGWATALVLAEINVDRQDEILKRGFELGQSRVICGYHWQSDVDAARIVGSAIVARLHASPQFTEQLAKAKWEFANKSGR